MKDFQTVQIEIFGLFQISVQMQQGNQKLGMLSVVLGNNKRGSETSDPQKEEKQFITQVIGEEENVLN